MKYRLTEETFQFGSHILHRIECVTAFVYVKEGGKGGWIESEENLSQYGDAWVYDNAKVSGDAKVYDCSALVPSLGQSWHHGSGPYLPWDAEDTLTLSMSRSICLSDGAARISRAPWCQRAR